jgi:bifunctional UDP-N-acetylglucosamine pyrophosphorylase/glucosamine-1-phosphate N-acetyltransferase
MTTIDRSNWREYAAPAVERACWTAVIAAAGKGTRLRYDRPKILYSVAGRSILEWLLRTLLPFCERVVLVLSPDGRPDIESQLQRLAPGRFRVVIQPVPTGMGDAVELGLAAVATPHTAVMWGDQAALEPASVEALLRLHQGPEQPDLTIPTVFRPAPYIHFERDAAGVITRVRQAREGDAMPVQGESDTGFFCFRTGVLRSLLRDARRNPAARGALSSEFNLLPVIPQAAAAGLRVLTPQVTTLEETVGINTAADAARLEPFLRRRHD